MTTNHISANFNHGAVDGIVKSQPWLPNVYVITGQFAPKIILKKSQGLFCNPLL